MSMRQQLAAARIEAASATQRLNTGDPIALIHPDDGKRYKAIVQGVTKDSVTVSWVGKWCDSPHETLPLTCVVSRPKVQSDPPASPSSGSSASPAEVRSMIELLYLNLTDNKFGAAVSLDKLRAGLPFSRPIVDQALRAILQGDKDQANQASLSQYSDPKSITPAIKAAAFSPAGEPFHLIRISKGHAANTDALPTYRDQVIAVLAQQGLNPKTLVFDGIITDSKLAVIGKALRAVDMERSPALQALSWFNRQKGLLFTLAGKTGQQYVAQFKDFK